MGSRTSSTSVKRSNCRVFIETKNSKKLNLLKKKKEMKKKRKRRKKKSHQRSTRLWIFTSP